VDPGVISPDNVDQLRLVTQEFLQRGLRTIAEASNIPFPTITVGGAVIVDMANLLRTVEFAPISVSFAGSVNIPTVAQINAAIIQLLQSPEYLAAVQNRVGGTNPFSRVVAINSVAAQIEGGVELGAAVVNGTVPTLEEAEAGVPAPAPNTSFTLPPGGVQLAVGGDACSLKARVECQDQSGNPCINTTTLSDCTAEGVLAEVVFRYSIENDGSNPVNITKADSYVNGGQAVEFSTKLEKNPIPPQSSARVLTFGEISINACFPIQISNIFEVEGTTADGTTCRSEVMSSFAITDPST
jgi:hypothetical protein